MITYRLFTINLQKQIWQLIKYRRQSISFLWFALFHKYYQQNHQFVEQKKRDMGPYQVNTVSCLMAFTVMHSISQQNASKQKSKKKKQWTSQSFLSLFFGFSPSSKRRLLICFQPGLVVNIYSFHESWIILGFKNHLFSNWKIANWCKLIPNRHQWSDGSKTWHP